MNNNTSIKFVVAGTGFPDVLPLIKKINQSAFQDYELLGFLDDNKENKKRNLFGFKILGGFDWIKDKEIFVFNSIARNPELRSLTTKKLKSLGAKFLSLVSPEIDIGYVKIGSGCLVDSGCYIGAKNYMKSLNGLANAMIGHDSKIDKNCFIGTGANIQGHVTIGKNSFVAAGAIIAPGVTIGANCKIGFNSIITNDIQKGQVYFSRPAQNCMGIKC